jgi:2-dehydropantoate 2-reductase
MPSSAPILILGTGALACLFAARCSAAGIPVTLLGTWPEGLEAIRRYGVRLFDTQGQAQTFPVQAVDDPQTCNGARQALVLVKSWQTGRAAHQLADCLAEDGLALTLQNGLGNQQILEQSLGANRVALGVTTLGANSLGPGQVRQAGDGTISLGKHTRITPLVEALQDAGFKVESTADPIGLLWGKLVINAAINPITALLGISNGELLERPMARSLAAMAAREAAAVAQSQGISLPYPDPVEAVEGVARRTAANRSSMLQDVQRAAPTEIDAICGAIVKAGARNGIPTPVNFTLWSLVNAMQKRTHETGEYIKVQNVQTDPQLATLNPGSKIP